MALPAAEPLSLVRSRTMPMRATTVRFAESLWTLVEQEAEREGVSAAQFIRDASVMRAAYAMGRRGDTDVEAVFGHLGGASEAESTGNGAARRRALLAAAAAARDPEGLRALPGDGLPGAGADPA